MNIVPDFEHDLSSLPVVTVTVLDAEGDPKTITIFGATYVEVYAAGKHDDGPAAAALHLREQAGDWKVVSQKPPTR
jgi:hypothetical protein